MAVNKFFMELLKSVPEDIKRENHLSMGIAALIQDALDSKNMTQREFASLMGKHESEISKWLSGKHNFTINTIAKIEAVLKILMVQLASDEDIGVAESSRRFRKYPMNDFISWMCTDEKQSIKALEEYNKELKKLFLKGNMPVTSEEIYFDYCVS